MTERPYFRLGLTGYPLGHSLSPRLHTAALAAARLPGEYQLYPADPAEPRRLAELAACLRAGELNGLNVTIPHKQAILAHLDGLTPLAQRLGAVNTLYMEGGRLLGDNTDAPGFWADFSRLPGAQTPGLGFAALNAGCLALDPGYTCNLANLINRNWCGIDHLESSQILKYNTKTNAYNFTKPVWSKYASTVATWSAMFSIRYTFN